MTTPTEAHIVPRQGCAVIVPALSISLFFDALDDEQLGGIRAAWGLIEAALAGRLRWYMNDSMAVREPLDKNVLAHVPAVLDQVRMRRPYYAFRAHGGPQADCLDSPALDLWVDKPRQIEGKERALLSAVFKVPDESVGRVANCLRLSFPAVHHAPEPQQIEQLTYGLMERMNLLHGHAGYALLFDDTLPAFEREHWSALAKLARRHPGYDALHYAAVRACAYDKIKTVNWLTLLGPDLSKAVNTKRLLAQEGVELIQKGPNLCIKAGPQPAIGDVNQGDTLPAYRAVARLLADVTCFDQAEFGGAFDEDLTRDWVRRFNDD